MAKRKTGLSSVMHRVRDWFATASAPPRREFAGLSRFQQLEERSLLSATPLDAELDATVKVVELSQTPSFSDVQAVEQPTPAVLASAVQQQPASEQQQVGLNAAAANPSSQHAGHSQQQARQELVVIDPAVADRERLVQELEKNNPERRLDVVVLDPDANGLDQISDILAGYADLDAVHIISHGSAGTVRLGNMWLTADDLPAYEQDLRLWGQAMETDADILFYGCNLAQSEAGQQLLRDVSVYTGADVAASMNATGHSSLGADWTLEYRQGSMESVAPFSRTFEEQWVGLLAVTTGTTDTAATGNGGSNLMVLSHTVGSGSDRILIVTLSVDGSPNINNVRFANTPMTLAGETTDSRVLSQIWYLLNPPTGTNDVRVSVSGGATFAIGVTDFAGVDQTTPFSSYVSASGTGTTPTLAVASAPGQLVVDVVASHRISSASVGAGQTPLWTNSTGTQMNDAWGGSSVEAGAASVTMSWSTNGNSSNWVMGAISLQAAPANLLIVDTTSNAADGNTSSISALLSSKGADGRISLREAILAANNTVNTAGPDRIYFNIAGTGPHTINLASALPTITEAVIIDGWSASGFAGTPVIELNGTGAGGGADGLHVTAGDTTIRGLVINRFAGNGIEISGGSGNTIVGNYIGTDVIGTLDHGNNLDGIYVDNSANNTIGGLTAAERNIISGNNIHGVRIYGEGADNNVIQGNYIGLNAAGTAGIGNSINGIIIYNGADNNLVGGTTAGAGNVISGNVDTGVEIQDSTATGNRLEGNIIGLNATGASAIGNLDGVIIEDAPNNIIGGGSAAHRNVISGNTGGSQGNGIVIFGTNATGNQVQNNYIGTDVTGTLDRGNTRDGVLIGDRGDGGTIRGAAGANTIRDNLISGNDSDGIQIEQGAVGNAILGNSIYANTGLGIELGTGSVVTPNDSGDGDNGPNRLQNAPVLTSAVATGGSVTIAGTLGSSSSGGGRTYRIEFFANSAADATGYGEGQRYLGFINVTTDGSGDASINVTLAATVAAGEFVSATATDLTTNDTSEFAQNRTASAANTPPTITSNSGGATASTIVTENSTAVTTVTASDPEAPPQTLTYSITGGADAAKFTINGGTGVLTFVAPPNFEAPSDVGGDNAYEVTVQVSDGNGGADTQAIAVQVTAANDAPAISAPASQAVNEDGSLVFSSGTGNAISVSDQDAGASPVTVTLTATNGTVTVADRLGTEFAINATTASNQQQPVVAVAPDGRYVVAWQSNNQDGDRFGIYARLFNANGTPASGEILVNTTTVDDQTLAGAAIDNSGNFVVVWQNSTLNDGWEIYSRTFDSGGSPLSGERRVNGVRTDDQTAPVVAMDAVGNFTVSWESRNQDGAGDGVYARRFNLSNTAQGGEFLVTTQTLDNQSAPAIARTPAGTFVIVWQSRNQDGSGDGIYGQRFNASGGKVGGEFLINTTTTDNQTAPAIAVDSTGNFVVAWQSRNQDGSGEGIYGQRFSAAGVKVGSEFRVNTTVAGDQTLAHVAYADNGAFMVVWQSAGQDNPDGKSGIFLRSFDASGNPLGGERLVNTFTLNDQIEPAISMRGNSQTVVVWQSKNQDGSGDGIFGQRFLNPGLVTFTVGDGQSDTTTTFTGTLANLNAVLSAVVYTPDADYYGAATLTVTANDQGNTGPGGPQTTNAVIGLTVNPVNDGPVLTVPGSQVAGEDVDLPITGINIVDIDAAAGWIRVTVGAANGIVTLAQTTGLTFSVGDGVADGSMTFTGTLADVNAALGVVTYRTTPDYYGSDVLTVTVNDQGNTGTPGSLADSGSFTITTSAVNDAPVNTIPGAQSTLENTPLVFSLAGGNRVAIEDVDAGTADVEVTLGVTNGTLTLNGVSGLTFLAGDGTADRSMTFRGQIVDINAALDGLRYTPTSGYSGPSFLSIITNDKGNSGAGGGLGDRDGIDITVLPNATNAAPQIFAPGPQATAEEVPLVFSAATGNGIAVLDDAGGNAIQITLTATDGTLSLGSTTGGEFLVNTTISSDQNLPVVAMAPNGGYVVVWQSKDQDGDGEGIYAQRYDRTGTPLEAEFLVNTTTQRNQTAPSVAVADDGSFVVVWSSDDQDSDNTGIFAQRYDANGGRVGGEFRVNTYTTRAQMAADVAMDSTGRFVVVWQSDGQDGDTWGIYGQVFAADGSRIGGEFRVNVASAKEQMAPAVAMDVDGDFVVTWQTKGSADDKWDIKTRRFAANGTAKDAGEILVNTISDREQTLPDVGMDDAGNFVVTWQSKDLDYPDNHFGIYAQRFAADGTAVAGGQFLVNSNTPEDQTAAQIAVAGDGSFVITWQSKKQDNQADSFGIFAQRFNSDGSPRDGELQVNTWTQKDQTNPALAAGDGGRFVIVWQSKGQDSGDTWGVYGQQYRDIRSLSFLTGDGTDDPILTLRGTQDEINDVLDGLIFKPNVDFTGTAQLKVEVDDLGNSGSGGSKTATKTINIAVSPVNDGPVITVPSSQSTTEGLALRFSSASGNRITVSDVDANANPVRVALAADGGVLTLAGTTGLTFLAGDGVEDTNLTMQGSLASINAALDGLVFEAPSAFTGRGGIRIAVDDLGNSGAGNSLQDAASVVISVNPDAVNQAPEVLVPNPQRTAVNTKLTLSHVGGNGITLFDDAGNNPVAVTLTVTNGTVTLNNSVGPEILVNTHQTGDQRYSAVAVMPGGGFVVVWQSNGQDGSGEGILAQRFDANGSPLGPEIPVNATTAGNQTNPAVAVTPTGEFIVAWESAGQDGDGSGIFAQQFDATGARVGSEFLVTTTVIGNQTAPVVAVNSTGRFAIAWEGPDGSGDGIFLQRYDAAGVALGAETVAHLATAGNQVAPTLAMDPAGNLILGWQEADSSGQGVFAQRFTAAGSLVGAKFQVNNPTVSGDQVLPVVAMNSAGQFVFAWQGSDANGDGIFLKSYNADGTVAVADTLVNTNQSGNQKNPSVALNDARQIIVGWEGADAGGAGVFGRRFDAAGNPLGNEFPLNFTILSNQTAPVVAIDAAGNVVASWTGDNQDADRTGVIAQRFLPEGALTYLTGDGQDDALIVLRGTVASINAALDGLIFTPAAGFTGVATIQTSVNDLGNSGSGGPLGDSDITQIVVGNAPRIDLDVDNSSGADGEGYQTTFTIGNGAVLIADSDAAVDDPNSGNLVSLTVTLTNRPDGASEILSANTAGTVIAASYSGGVLTLTGTDTKVHYQQVLRTIRYNNTAPSPTLVTRTIQFVTSDGGLSSNVAEATVAFAGTDTSAPVLVNNTGSTVIENDNGIIASVELRYSDAQPPASIGYTVTGGLLHGQLELSTAPGTAISSFTQADIDAGRLLYAHDGSETISETFTFNVSDGLGHVLSGQSFSITILPVNDPPGASNDSYSVNEDNVLSVPAAGLLLNDSDAEGDALTAVLVGSPSNGSVILNADGSFDYTPNADFHGTDSFTYRASDGSASSNLVTVTITVNSLNDVPVAADDSYSAAMNLPLLIAAPGVLANDADVDGDPIFASLVSGPGNGILVFNPDGSFLYTPNLAFTGMDSFTYEATDLAGNSNVATVTINVNLGNSPPNAVGDSYTVNEDATLTVAASGVLANDADVDGNPFTAVYVSGPAKGSLLFNSDGSFTYTPNGDFNGTDSFTYRADDGMAQSALTTVTITVSAVNDSPVAGNDSYNVNEDGTLNVAAAGVLANDSDVDGNPITAVLVSTTSNGSLVLNADGSFSYTPNANFNGTDSFTYRADDGTAQSALTTVTITVNAVNDPSVASNDTYNVNEDNALTVAAGGVLDNDSDIDGDPLTAVLVGGASNGTLMLNSDGSFTYTPVANFHGTDSFSYRANDAAASSNLVTVTITVNSVNDAPIAANHSYSVNEGTTLSVGSNGVLQGTTDVEGDPLTASLIAGVNHGTLSLNSDGSFTYIPAANFHGTDSFSYAVTDGVSVSSPVVVSLTVAPTSPPTVTPVPGVLPAPGITPVPGVTPAPAPALPSAAPVPQQPTAVVSLVPQQNTLTADRSLAPAASSGSLTVAASSSSKEDRSGGLRDYGLIASQTDSLHVEAYMLGRADSLDLAAAGGETADATPGRGLSAVPRIDLPTRDDSPARTTSWAGELTSTGVMAATGLMATAGYVLLNTRALSWLLTVVASRSAFNALDPMEVLFRWEKVDDRETRKGKLSPWWKETGLA